MNEYLSLTAFNVMSSVSFNLMQHFIRGFNSDHTAHVKQVQPLFTYEKTNTLTPGKVTADEAQEPIISDNTVELKLPNMLGNYQRKKGKAHRYQFWKIITNAAEPTLAMIFIFSENKWCKSMEKLGTLMCEVNMRSNHKYMQV